MKTVQEACCSRAGPWERDCLPAAAPDVFDEDQIAQLAAGWLFFFFFFFLFLIPSRLLLPKYLRQSKGNGRCLPQTPPVAPSSAS